LIVKDLHSPDNFTLAFDDPAIVTADQPWAGATHSRAVDRGEFTARVNERHKECASGVACGAEEIILFNFHTYNLTEKIVPSTIFLKKFKKTFDYINY
jgi:hypothetical protein